MTESTTFRARRALLPWLLVLAGCAAPGPRDALETDVTPPTRWQVGLAEHVSLWYHGMAYARNAAPPDPREVSVLPAFAPGYVERIVAVKRRRGVYPTVLDRRAAEFGELFRGDETYDALEFLPLYFRDAEALFSAVEYWASVGGDPRRAGSREAARVVAFLSNVFPRREQRRVVAEWATVLEQELQAFYRAYWTERAAELAPRVQAVQREWDALAPELASFLDYLQLEGGEVYLVPALGVEGRTVARGPTEPRIALLTPEAAQAEDAVWSFVHELLYPLVGEVIRDQVAPARIREIGEDVLASRAAVRGGSMLLAEVAPARVDRYRRYFLTEAGREAPADDEALEAAFVEAFPLPPGLEAGLAEAVANALAGI